MPRIYLSHGASGSAAGLAPQIVGLARRGVDAVAVQLPKGRAEAAMATYLAAAAPSAEVAIGGHSFGGRVASPVLLLSGDRDPFARIGLLREAVHRLRHAELVVYPGLGHGIGPVFEEALDRVADFVKATIA